MRIVHVIGHYAENLGYEENCLPMAQARAGNDVALVTSNRSLPEFARIGELGRRVAPRRQESNLDLKGVKLIRLPSVPPLSGLLILSGLAKTIRQLSPDIVHSHGALNLYTIQCLMNQRKLGYHLVIDDHSHSHNVRTDAPARIYVRAVKTAYGIYGSSISRFISVTPAATDFLKTQLKIPQTRIFQGALGADPDIFKPSAAQRASLRGELGLSPDDVLIMTAGKITRGKNLEVLLDGFAQVAQSHDEVRLLLAGVGRSQYLTTLDDLIARLGLEDKIFRQGFIPHDSLARYFNGADLGVWPGSHSITVLEAMSTGLPCILPVDDFAYRQVIESGACLGFRSGGSDSLVKAIERLVTDHLLRASLSTRSRALIEESLSWKRIAANLLTLYEELLVRH